MSEGAMAIVRITGVDRPRAWDEELGYCLDEPGEGETSDGYRLDLSGWVLGRGCPVEAVEIVVGGKRMYRLPVVTPRRDIATEYPDIPWSLESGFRGTIGVLRLPSSFELRLQAVLKDDRRVPLGTVR